MPESVELCLTGDVMLGRGVDQIQRHPGDPGIGERWARSALQYVELAEEHSGPIPRAVSPQYVWGEALDPMADADARIVNLETAVTDRGEPWPGKPIQYRMHPGNVDSLAVAGIDAVSLANNHILDWSVPGLEQTVEVLAAAGIPTVGAGRDAEAAWAPALVDTTAGRVVVFGAGSPSSGIPPEWAADDDRPGVALLPDLSDATVDRIASVVASAAAPGDVVVLSVHWGGNWGYAIPDTHRGFARGLIDRAGVDVVHGHSSHHPLGIEVYHERLVLYGCGDLITDYEGIRGHERFRGDLGALYLPTIDPASGSLRRLELVPTRVRRLRLTQPPEEDRDWLADVLNRESATLGTRVSRHGERLRVEW